MALDSIKQLFERFQVLRCLYNVVRIGVDDVLDALPDHVENGGVIIRDLDRAHLDVVDGVVELGPGLADADVQLPGRRKEPIVEDEHMLGFTDVVLGASGVVGLDLAQRGHHVRVERVVLGHDGGGVHVGPLQTLGLRLVVVRGGVHVLDDVEAEADVLGHVGHDLQDVVLPAAHAHHRRDLVLRALDLLQLVVQRVQVVVVVLREEVVDGVVDVALDVP